MEAHYAGCRRILALVKGLPEDAACNRRDGKVWTGMHELVAFQIELTDVWGRNLYALMYKKFAGKKPEDFGEPLRIPRPGVELRQIRQRRKVSMIEAVRKIVG